MTIILPGKPPKQLKHLRPRGRRYVVIFRHRYECVVRAKSVSEAYTKAIKAMRKTKHASWSPGYADITSAYPL